MTNTKEKNHAISNASAWVESIVAMVKALHVDYVRLAELQNEHEELFNAQNDSSECKAALFAWLDENDAELRRLTMASGDCQSIDQARDAINESPLSVEVRSPWYSPGADVFHTKPQEFNILLSTGGPALRIIGDLNDYGQPTACQMEYQDWGTPWTEYDATSEEVEVMLEFCQQFYFGE